jgi:hypothetical protein
MRGAVAVSAELKDIQILSGQDVLTLYQFNTMEAKHYFCSKCGIYTHHQRRSDPTQYGINVACLEGVSPFDFEKVPVNEGRIHPRDRAAGNGPSIAGYLRFIPNQEKSNQ